MKKQLQFALFFLALILITMGLGLYCNAYTPVLHMGEELAEDAGRRIYALDINPLRGQSGTPTLTFPATEPAAALSMLVSGTTPFRAYSAGELLYEYDAAGYAQRMHVFSLPSNAYANDTLAITFEIENGLSRADILLGNTADIAALAAIADNISMLILGTLLMIMLYSLSLYIAKRSERYLAMLATICGLTILVFLNDMSSPLLHLPRWMSEPVRNFSQIGPAFIFALALLSLCRVDLPPRLAFMTKKPVLYITLGILLTVLLSLNQYSVYLEPIARVLFITATIAILLFANVKKERGTLLLIGGYAVFHGLGACFDIIKHMHLVTGGTLPVLVRLPQLGNFVFLCCATVKISFRFGDTFDKAVALAAELDALNASLDAKVAQRTQQLADQQTQKHRLMLNIFHDLRSPIFTIQGCLRKLRKNGGACTMEEDLSVLHERVMFIDRLTEDLFTIAKLEENDLLLAMDVMDFSELCERQCEAIAITAAEKGIGFHTVLLAGISVWGDQLRLEQAIQNLLANAIAYTPAGKSIYVSMAQNAQVCTLSVRDTGPGIAPADIKHIFSRYYRVDRAENRKSTGLGLSIANEIAELHKGSLQVESVVGEGTTFRLCLPLCE